MGAADKRTKTKKRGRTPIKRKGDARECSMCGEQRAEVDLFEWGRAGSALLGCLVCVANNGVPLECRTCDAQLACSDGHDPERISVCCYTHHTRACTLASDTLACHACGDAVCDVAFSKPKEERRFAECVKVFCPECLAAARPKPK